MPSILSKNEIRRILVSLVAAQQRLRIRHGTMPKECAVDLHIAARSSDEIDALRVDEEVLGFDSLSRIDLAMRVTQFFNLSKSGVDDYLLVRRRIGDWIDLINHHLAMLHDEACFTFETSGSTGKPKRITHSFFDLKEEIDALIACSAIDLKNESRIISFVPSHHIYGFLFSCLMPSTRNLEVVDLRWTSPTSLSRIAQSNDLVIATPLTWTQLNGISLDIDPGVRGLTSGAPSDQDTWSIVREKGLTSLMELYGSTETGGIGYRKSITDDFELMGHLSQKDEKIYKKQSEYNALAVQDRLEWTEKDRFRVLGRIDDVVQVAGVNVSTTYVSDAVCSIEGVQSAKVTFEQQRIIAHVVTSTKKSDAQEFKKCLQRDLCRLLEPSAQPSVLTVEYTQ